MSESFSTLSADDNANSRTAGRLLSPRHESLADRAAHDDALGQLHSLHQPAVLPDS